MDPISSAISLILVFFIVSIVIIFAVYYFAYEFFQSIFNSSHNRFISLLVLLGTFFFVTGAFDLIQSTSKSNTACSFNWYNSDISCEDQSESYRTFGTIYMISSIILFLISLGINFMLRPKVGTNIRNLRNLRRNI